MNVDDGLEDIRWIRGLGGEKLLAASYALVPNPKKKFIFCHRRGIENFCRLFSTRQRPNVFVADAWLVPATYHWPCYELCDQRGGLNPERARLVQIS